MTIDDSLVESGHWIDEKGKEVSIILFFPLLFKDEQTRAINGKYDLYTPPEDIGGLGKTEYESAANSLADLCYAVRSVVGVEYESLEKAGKFYNDIHFEPAGEYACLVGYKLVRIKEVAGTKVLFPTEELIQRAFKPRAN